MYENILYQTADGVATITLNRPQVHNALSPGLIQDITQAVGNAQADASVRVVVLTGAGDKAFCSGADLKAGMQGGMSLGDSLRANYNPMILAIRAIPKPVVCRMNGLAAGAGCSLALACDVVIASDDAYLCQIFINIGLMPDAGSSYFLPHLVGARLAFELASTGRRVYGPEAERIGLINRSVPPHQLDYALAETLSYYKNAPTQAIGRMKSVLNDAFGLSLAEILEREAENQDELGRTSDAAEGITAFLQKRTATYKGL